MDRDFVWGVSTSSYQIEGAAQADGRGPSVWDGFCRVPGRIANGDTGDVACDHYHRYAEDIALMRELGVQGLPVLGRVAARPAAGRGTPNEAGLAFYDRLVDGLLAAASSHGSASTTGTCRRRCRSRRLDQPRHRRLVRRLCRL